MAKWRKRFLAWETAKQPIARDEVESILHRVFGDRVTVHEGGSHRWTVSTPELVEHAVEFQFGHFGIPLKGGREVKARYCQTAHKAALLLGLLEEADDDEDEEQEDDA